MANPREPLTPERIDAAALALVDEGGMRALSMRKLGAALGVDPMAIYHHVPNKTAVVHRVVRSVFAAMPAPSADLPWDERVRAWVRAYRAVVVAHPSLIMAIVTDAAAVAVAVEATQALPEALAASGLPAGDVDLCADVVVDHANGALLAWAADAGGTGPEPKRAERLAAGHDAGLEVVLAGIRARIP